MLTADLVRATCRSGHLHVTPLAGKHRARAEELASAYLAIAAAHTGAAQHELKEALAAVDIAPREAKLAAGLIKLIEDTCEFEAESPVEPRVLRSELFTLTARARRELAEGERFDRRAALQSVASAHGLDPERLEHALYSDLKSEHRLLRAAELSPAALLERYDLAQLQAVLLRAVKISAHISCASAAAYRDLFRKLKFRRLLFQVRPDPSGGYHIDIDGPFSLFESVTKYGLQLALMLPALLAAGDVRLEAQLRWGKTRTPATFTLEHHAHGADAERARLPDEVQSLLDAFQSARDGWRAEPADDVFDLPGVGLCIPDLRFRHASGTSVHLEVLGYWSRDAVWQRIELVQQGVDRGLGRKLLFAASERLRVSEQALADHPSGALYVYKNSLSPKALVQHLERLRAS